LTANKVDLVMDESVDHVGLSLDKLLDFWSVMILNYQMMMERYPNLKEEVGGSIPACEISSLPVKKLAKWLDSSCALALACRPSV
jgi:hypothetical protein